MFLDDGFIDAGDGGRRLVPISVSSRADNCRASSLKALFSTGVSDGGLVSPGGRNGKTFFDVSVAISLGVPRRYPNRLGVKSR